MAAYVASGRGKVIEKDGYTYAFHRTTDDTMQWRCSRRATCSAMLRTLVFDREEQNPRIRIINEEGHNHPCDYQRIQRLRFVERACEQVREDPTVPLRRVFDAEVAQEHRRGNQGGGDRPELPTFHSLRSILRRARAGVLPPIPESVEDVIIDGTWAETWNGDQFLLHLDNDWGYAVFSTQENMDALGGCGTLYMDGTFRSCPHPYNQVFTILGNVEGFVVPLVNVLMENRTTGSYRQIFQKVKGFIRRRTHHHWRPRRVIADFEIALSNALEIELPHTLRSGCYFHLTQSFWKKIQQLGLAQPYMMNQRLQDTLRKVMALGYLPVAVLRNNFLALRQSRRTRRLVNTFPSLQDFFNYVENTYILPTAAFPPAVWNVHNRNMSQRSNNHAENYHRMLNEAIGVRHPSLWVFIRVLKDKQAQTENALAAAERGDAPPARRKKWRDLEERLLRLKAQYNAGQRNLDSFWRAVARSVWSV